MSVLHLSVLHGLRAIGCGVSLCALGLGCGGGTLGGERGPGDDSLRFADAGEPATPTPRAPERCGNGLDDDGNGQIDDGCACTRGETQRCFGGDPRLAGVGPCVYGTQRCVGDQEFPAWGACGGFGQPQAERCGNQLDDDCDGTADEGCSSETPACGPQGCGYVAHAESRCVNPNNPTNQSAMNWYWFDSNKVRQERKAACQPAPGDAINCSHREGCCTPHGVAINDHCVPYAKQGERCYASNQCVAPLVCNGQGVCVGAAPSPVSCLPAGGEPWHSGSFLGQRWTHCITAPEEGQGFVVGRVITPGDTDVFWSEARNAERCCSGRLRVVDHEPNSCGTRPPAYVGPGCCAWLLRCE